MVHLADRYQTRSMPDISRKDWPDYVAIRLLEGLHDVTSITESLAVPVCGYGFNHERGKAS